MKRLGNTLVKQFKPHCLVLAHSFTLPAAVGGYDVSGEPRWRRPDKDTLRRVGGVTLTEEVFKGQPQRPSANVGIADLVSGLPRRIEAQFRRHWHFVPGLFNLFFRHLVYRSPSSQVSVCISPGEPQEAVEQHAALSARALYPHSITGVYKTPRGRKRRVDGDVSKLPPADGLSIRQK